MTDSTGNAEDQNLQEQQKTQISGGPGASVSGAGQSGGVAPAQKPSSSGFTNVNQYVEANKDQSAGLGNKIAQGVEQTASRGLQGLSQAQQEFNQQQQAAGVNPGDYNAASVSQKIQADVAKSQVNPKDQGIQSDIQQFQNVQAKNKALQAGSDTAAKTLSDVRSYAPAAQTLTEAQQAAGLTGTESGRATLLRGGTIASADQNNPNAQIKITGGFERPSYSAGQVNLDQLLTQNAPQNAQALGALRSNLLGQYGLASQEAQAIQNAAQTRQGVIQGTNQAAQNIQTQVGNVLNPYEQELQARPGQLNQQQQQNIQSAQTALTNYLQTVYGAKPFGIDAATLAQQIVSPQSNVGVANINNVLNTNDIAKLETLNQLAGNEADVLNLNGTNTLLDTSAIGQNAAFNPNVNLNYGAANPAVQQQENIYTSNVTGTLQPILDSGLTNFGRSYTTDPAQVSKYNQISINALNQVNDLRSQYGFPKISVTPEEVAASSDGLIKNEAGKINAPLSMDRKIQIVQNHMQSDPNYNSQITNAAYANATANLINTLNVNPLMNVSTNELVQGPSLDQLLRQYINAAPAAANTSNTSTPTIDQNNTGPGQQVRPTIPQRTTGPGQQVRG